MNDTPTQSTQSCPCCNEHAAENAVLREQLIAVCDYLISIQPVLLQKDKMSFTRHYKDAGVLHGAIDALLADPSPAVARVEKTVRLAEAAKARDIAGDNYALHLSHDHPGGPDPSVGTGCSECYDLAMAEGAADDAFDAALSDYRKGDRT